MYKEFYGLVEDPFTISPNPKFLHLSHNHREGISHLLYGIERKKSPIILTGDIGTGKTTLLYTLIEKIDKKTHIAFLVNSQLNITEILQHILYEFRLEVHSKSKGELLIDLKKFLKHCEESKEKVLVILDEAQNFSPAILEELRLLTNIENSSEKLIQLILVGQLGLEENLKLPELAQLRQRIGANYRLLPISYHEVKNYIETRLAVAGATRPIFTTEAVEAIYTFSKGIPRVINVMCDLALFFGFTDKKSAIGRRIIQQVQESLNFNESAASPDYSPRKWRNNESTDAVVIRQARGGITQEPSKQSKNPRGSAPLEKPRVERRFSRLGYTVIVSCVVLLGLLGGGLAWVHREDIAGLIAQWSQSLQHLLMLEQSSIEVIETSANARSNNHDMPNHITKDYGESVDPKVNDSDESITKGDLSTIRKKDTGVDKRIPPDIREQSKEQKVVIVQPGDTLSKIIIKEYGQYDRDTLDLVVKENPNIIDISFIEVGQRITIPKFSKSGINN